MRRLWFSLLLALAAATFGGLAAAQQSRMPPKVGLLLVSAPDPDKAQWARPFRDGMEALGWSEGRNIAYEFRFASGLHERLVALALELVAGKVAVIVGFDTEASIAAREASRSIPVVIAGSADPVGIGLVASLARPGGNVTGVSMMMRELAPKQLELLKESAPRTKRVGVLHSGLFYQGLILGDLAAAAPKLGIEIHDVPVTAEADLPERFQTMAAAGVDGIQVLPGALLDGLRGRIAELAIQHQMPSIGLFRSSAHAGFMISYSPSLPAVHRRAAGYVDRILKGANPAEMAIEQPTEFELVVNISTAWALAITIPPSILVHTEQVIE